MSRCLGQALWTYCCCAVELALSRVVKIEVQARLGSLHGPCFVAPEETLVTEAVWLVWFSHRLRPVLLFMDGHPPPNCRSPSFQGLLPLNKNILDFLWKWKSWNGWWRFWIYGSIGCNFCSKPCPNLYLYFLSFFFVSFCVQIRVQTWLKKASISSISLIAIQVNCFYTPTNPLVLKDFRLKGEICEWVGTTPAWIFLNLGGHPRGEGQVKQDLKNLDGHDSALDLMDKVPFFTSFNLELNFTLHLFNFLAVKKHFKSLFRKQCSICQRF